MHLTAGISRIVVAGAGGDSGKTIVSLALIAELRRRGLGPVAFKKGPDYIDSAWLSWASGTVAYNLDTFLMGDEGVLRSFLAHSEGAGISIIEGNRGLLDGMDAAGTHSTATLARTIRAPVILVLSVRKVTGSVAAWVEGFRRLATDVDIRGVVLNRVSGHRHGRVTSMAVEALGIPVLGMIPTLDGDNMLPDRHLGLVTPEEHGHLDGMLVRLGEIAAKHLMVDRLLQIAADVAPLDSMRDLPMPPSAEKTRIGVFRDSAFTFYYPDNLEALVREGARLVDVSPLADDALPDVDGLLIGGGFPETHAEILCRNRGLKEAVRGAVEGGLPVYAECGGLMYLSRAMNWRDKSYPMSGVFPFDVVMCDKPQGHGYSVARVDEKNPFFDVGTVLKGHEFHYSTIDTTAVNYRSAYAVERGTGCGGGRDAATCKNALAAYIHLHARGCPEWAQGVVRAARRFRSGRGSERA